MKLATYLLDGETRIGAILDEQIVDLSNVAPDMLTLINMSSEGLTHASATIEKARTTHPISDVQLLAPIPIPLRNIMCLGLNYAAHVKESNSAKEWNIDTPEIPVVFTKATTSVIGPDAVIPYDSQITTELDWEVELAVIIGNSGINISAEQAMDYIFGFTVINDISARDLQRKGKQFFKGKSLDGACPMGPWIVTPDELGSPQELTLSCRVNGITKQTGRTDQMIFDIATTIAYLSQGMTLIPGDVIATGTPDGVGFARTPPEFLQPGDLLESEIEGIGILLNHIQTV